MTTLVRPLRSGFDARPDEILLRQREAWEARPLLRELYRGWYRLMEHELATAPGPTVELGCGIGTFKEFMPSVTATDIESSAWTDEVVDATRLPYGDGTVANLVMIDVLHHLPEPLRCLEEARRVLAPGGRVVMVEPFCSPLSTPMYRAMHHEPVDLSADPFRDGVQTGDDPWDANTALPTLLFWRGLDRYGARFPELPVVTRRRLAWLVYPLSGGFSGRQLATPRLSRILSRVEALLPMERLAAFRCLVTLERR